MKVFIVFAHPELKSFNGSLFQDSINYLKSQGHEVKFTDLYRDNFKAVVDEDDFKNFDKNERLHPAVASYMATATSNLTADVIEEQEKLKWADLVIFQFPLWWYSMPAIMKGWFDRVYSCGFAYAVGEVNDKKLGDRFGEGLLEGKKAMICVTMGGYETHYSKRGINGSIDDILFPINHNLLFYPGFTVLPSVVNYVTDKADDERYDSFKQEYFERLDNTDTVKPIAYRKQNFGDYTIPDCELKENLEKPGETGYDIHIIK